jgi:hypothetical protein
VRRLQAQSVMTPRAKAPTPMRPMTRVRDPPPEKKGVVVGEGEGDGGGGGGGDGNEEGEDMWVCVASSTC